MHRFMRLSVAAALVTASSLFGITAFAAHGPTGGNGAQCVYFANDNGTYTVEFITPSGHIVERHDAKQPPAGCQLVI